MTRQQHGVSFAPLPGLVTSHSCDIDKYEEEKHGLSGNQKKAWPVSVAPLFSLETLSAGQAGDVRSSRHRRFFHIPREGPNREMMADLWFEQPVPLVLLLPLSRMATLSPEWLARLWTHAFVGLTRKDPAEVFVGGQLGP